MTTAFDTILVPIDFSVNTDTALEKAIALCSDQGCIHLFHVLQADPSLKGYLLTTLLGVSIHQIQATRIKLKFQLNDLKERIMAKRPDINVLSWVDHSQSVEKAIIKKAKYLGANLIIIGKNKNQYFGSIFSTVVPSRIAQLTGLAVLTARPGSLETTIRTVVISLGNKYPSEKIKLLSALDAKQRLKIRLVSFEKNSDLCETSIFQILRTLRAMTPFPIEYDVLKGYNAGRELLHYCQNVSANLLIVQAGAETRVKGWPKRFLSDIHRPDSITQILAPSTG